MEELANGWPCNPLSSLSSHLQMSRIPQAHCTNNGHDHHRCHLFRRSTCNGSPCRRTRRHWRCWRRRRPPQIPWLDGSLDNVNEEVRRHSFSNLNTFNMRSKCRESLNNHSCCKCCCRRQRERQGAKREWEVKRNRKDDCIGVVGKDEARSNRIKSKSRECSSAIWVVIE